MFYINCYVLDILNNFTFTKLFRLNVASVEEGDHNQLVEVVKKRKQ